MDISTNCGIEEKLTEDNMVKVNIEETTTELNSVDWNLYKDPFFWPKNMPKSFIECCIEKGPDYFQNLNSDFINSKRSDKNFNRHLTLAMFTRSLPNGQKCNRKWLLYSPSEGSVYCFVCKLYGSNRESAFISGGFDKWKKSERIGKHENSLQHRNATNKWLLRSNTNNSVNKELCRQISAETNY